MSVGGKLSTNPTGSAMAVPTSLPRLKMTPIQRIQARLATTVVLGPKATLDSGKSSTT